MTFFKILRVEHYLCNTTGILAAPDRAGTAAEIAWHNFCLWLNEQLGRPRLALVDW